MAEKLYIHPAKQARINRDMGGPNHTKVLYLSTISDLKERLEAEIRGDNIDPETIRYLKSPYSTSRKNAFEKTQKYFQKIPDTSLEIKKLRDFFYSME